MRPELQSYRVWQRKAVKQLLAIKGRQEGRDREN